MTSEQHTGAENGARWKPSQEFYGKQYFSGGKGLDESGYGDAETRDWIDREFVFMSGLAKFIEFGTVLDVGCARGALVAAAQKCGSKACGADYSFYPLSRPIAESLTGRLVQADAATLPFPGKSFDLVVSQETLEHVPPERVSHAVSEMARVSRAYVALTVATTSIEPFPRLLSHAELPKDMKGAPLHGHICLANSWWWEEKLSEAGLVVDIELTRRIRQHFGGAGAPWFLFVCKTRQLYPTTQKYLSALAEHKSSYDVRLAAQQERLKSKGIGEVGTVRGLPWSKWIALDGEDMPGWAISQRLGTLRPGVWSIVFAVKRKRLHAEVSRSDVLYMQVIAGVAGRVVATLAARPSALPEAGRVGYYKLTFLSSGESDFECRGYYGGGADIEILLARGPHRLSSSLFRRAWDKALRILQRVEFVQLSGLMLPGGYHSWATHVKCAEEIVLSSPATLGSRYLLCGPWTKLPVGMHRVTFHLEMATSEDRLPADAPVLTLDVVSGTGATKHAERIIRVDDRCPGRVESALEFESKGEAGMQFRVLSHGSANVSVIFPPTIERLDT